MHSNVAFSDPHCGSRPWQSDVAQHSEPRYCSKPITEAPKTEQGLKRPLSGWALHSHASCFHTNTRGLFFAASLPGSRYAVHIQGAWAAALLPRLALGKAGAIQPGGLVY